MKIDWDLLLEYFPDVLKADGFDDAIIGFDDGSNRLIYSRDKVVEVLYREMPLEEAIEYAEYNTFGSYVGEQTPIFAYDFFLEKGNETDSRPWGTYEVLLDSPTCKVKQIVVDPGQRLSYQYHFFRREQWIVTQGVLTVILDGEEFTVLEGESISIPLGAKHRAWNKTETPVSFIEVQTGESFDESDIVRVEDDYERD